MKRLIIAGLSAFLIFCPLSAASAAGNGDLAPLKEWIGKYPYDEINGHDLLATDLFAKRIKALLGEERTKLFEEEFWRGVTFPVREKDGLVLFHFCKPHECTDDMIYIYANLASGRMEACWQRRVDVQAYWLAEGDAARDIGAAGCLDDLPFGLYQKYGKGK